MFLIIKTWKDRELHDYMKIYRQIQKTRIDPKKWNFQEKIWKWIYNIYILYILHIVHYSLVEMFELVGFVEFFGNFVYYLDMVLEVWIFARILVVFRWSGFGEFQWYFMISLRIYSKQFSFVNQIKTAELVNTKYWFKKPWNSGWVINSFQKTILNVRI